MAKVKKVGNKLLLSGRLGTDTVYKIVNGKQVVCKYPDMSHVTYNRKQKKAQRKFADAVAYAQSINNNAKKKAAFQKKLKEGESVFQAAVKKFMEKKSR